MASAGTENLRLIAQITVGLENLTEAVDSMRGDIKEVSQQHQQTMLKMTAADTKTGRTESDIAELFRVVRDGNGQPSLVMRVTQFDLMLKHCLDKLDGIDKSIAGINNRLDEVSKVATEALNVKTTSRGKVLVGVISIVIVATMSLWAVIAQLMKP